MESKLNPN